MSSITELNRTNRTQSTRLVRFCLEEKTVKRHPVSIESERSPSRMYLKQFENKNSSMKWFIIDKFTINTGKRASTGTSSRRKCPSWLRPSSVTFRAGFCRIPVVLENRRSSRGGGGGPPHPPPPPPPPPPAHPLHPPPISAPGLVSKFSSLSLSF